MHALITTTNTDFIFFKRFFKARDLQHPMFKSRILGHEVSAEFLGNFIFSLIVLFSLTLRSCDFPMTYCACHAVVSILSKTLEIETSAKRQVFEEIYSKKSVVMFFMKRHLALFGKIKCSSVQHMATEYKF
jgi:hypothetical protein